MSVIKISILQKNSQTIGIIEKHENHKLRYF
jgi:hypothetical protein